MKTIEFYSKTIDLHQRHCDWCENRAEVAYERIEGRGKHTARLIFGCANPRHQELAHQSANPKAKEAA